MLKKDRLYSIFLKNLYRNPDKIYFHSTYGKLSYKQSGSIINSVAGLLEDLVKDQKDRIISISYKNTETLFFIIWACIKTEISLVLLPQLKDKAYVMDTMRDAGASILLSDVAELDEISKKINIGAIAGNITDDDNGSGEQPEIISTHDASFIFHTSGTTGAPKLVKVEFFKFLKVISYLFENEWMKYAINQVVYIVPSLFHSYGLSSMIEYTMGGSAIKLPGDISFLSSVKELAGKESDITAIESVPYFYQQLSLLLPKLNLQSLDHIGFGGDAVNPDVFEKLKERFYGISFSVRYGLTETPSVVSLNVMHPPYTKSLSGGEILPFYEVVSADMDDASGDGELLIKSKYLGAYLDDIEDPEWFKTGDMGYTSDNMMFITGRSSSMIKNRGFRISPAIIESAISAFPEVNDCMVSMVNNMLTAKIKVENRETFDKQKLLQMLNERLPVHYVPNNIVFADEISRTVSGKIIRMVLS